MTGVTHSLTLLACLPCGCQTKICKAVIACRVSPDQKRSIVEMVVSNDPHVRALSIGTTTDRQTWPARLPLYLT